MKSLRLYLPAGILALAACLWFSHQASQAASLRGELESLRATASQRMGNGSRLATQPQGSDESDALARQIASLREELKHEAATVEATEKALAGVRAKLPPIAADETVVSFGRIADMGEEAGQAIRGISELFTGGNQGRSREEVQASFMKLIAWMPEIAGFEEQPAEIACFQAAVFRQVFELDETRTRQVEAILKTHFAALKAGGLTAAKSAEPAWRERRSAVLTPLLWQLRPFIPPDFKSPGIVSQIVNAGAGMETKTETHLSPEPGKSSTSVMMSLPSWPRLPWLPAEKK
jgi:hypothetical protein